MSEGKEKAENYCEDCGQAGQPIGDTVLCVDCYQVRGSSCAPGKCDEEG